MVAATLQDHSRARTRTRRSLPALLRSRAVLPVGAALLVALAGAAWIALPKATVKTDDAYLQADSSTVAPKVRGLVAEVLVGHNQPVRRGQPLVRIDPEEFDARSQSAAADLLNAKATELAGRAAFSELAAQQRLAQAKIVASRASVRAADAQDARAAADRWRYERLLSTGFVAAAQVDHFRADAIAAASGSASSRAEVDVSLSQLQELQARTATLSANLAEASAQVARAQAALNLARQDQSHALVLSPIDGVVGDRQAEPGDYVQPGTRLMTVVPLRALYVTANFKETQVGRMRPGQPALVKVDAAPGLALKGEVESFAPGSGSQFSLLPFEPGTGNFTKIVQRVPVRIRLLPGQAGLSRLRPGLSANVRVQLATR
ncbi:MAG: efflux transporter, family, subunit [Phenylobacterium sp.]|nr:efflux transporter, family, subunit [Phenylobacterium sp.]